MAKCADKFAQNDIIALCQSLEQLIIDPWDNSTLQELLQGKINVKNEEGIY